MKNKLGEPLISDVNRKQYQCFICDRKFFEKSPAYNFTDRSRFPVNEQVSLAHLVVCSGRHAKTTK